MEIVANTRAVIQTGVELNASTAESLRSIYGVSTEISTISDQLVAAVQGRVQRQNTCLERNIVNGFGNGCNLLGM